MLISELNSSGRYGESSRPYWYQEMLRERREEAEREQNALQLRQLREPQPQPARIGSVPDPARLRYGLEHVQVSLAKIRGVTQAVNCEPVGDRHVIPNFEFRKTHHYSTRAVIEGNIKCVIYVDEHGQVFGAKLLPSPDERFVRGK